MCLFVTRMSCTSKRSASREDTEEFEKIAHLLKVLQRLEYRRHRQRDGKINPCKLQEEILATVKLLHTHLHHYSMELGHTCTTEADESQRLQVVLEENRQLQQDVDRLRQRLGKMHEIKVQLDSQMETAEDNYQEMKLRVDKLRENELRHNDQISRLHKEIEGGNSEIYRLTDENKALKEEKFHLEEKLSFAEEEIENSELKFNEEQREMERQLQNVQHLEESVQSMKILISSIRTKLNLSEADRFKLEGELVKCQRKVEDLETELEQHQKKVEEMEKESKEMNNTRGIEDKTSSTMPREDDMETEKELNDKVDATSGDKSKEYDTEDENLQDEKNGSKASEHVKDKLSDAENGNYTVLNDSDKGNTDSIKTDENDTEDSSIS